MAAFMLDRANWLNYIKTSLGYPVVNIYMTDEMIEQQISFALQKVLPYVNAVEFIEVGKKTVFTDRLIYAVIRVHEMGYVDSSTSTNAGTSYYDLLLARSIYNQMGGTNTSIYDSSSGLVNAALYNAVYEEVRADFNPLGYRLIGNTLYVDSNGNSEGPFTAEVISDRSIHNMTEDYQCWVMEMSVALCKQVEARVLRKVKITGSPVEQDGEALMQEGITRQKELEERLGNQMSLYFCTR